LTISAQLVGLACLQKLKT